MRTQPRPRSICAQTLTPVLAHCPVWQHRLCSDYPCKVTPLKQGIRRVTFEHGAAPSLLGDCLKSAARK
jgi:hypothetical protein